MLSVFANGGIKLGDRLTGHLYSFRGYKESMTGSYQEKSVILPLGNRTQFLYHWVRNTSCALTAPP